MHRNLAVFLFYHKYGLNKRAENEKSFFKYRISDFGTIAGTLLQNFM